MNTHITANILAVSANDELQKRFHEDLTTHHYQVRFCKPEHLQDNVNQERPDLIVVDVSRNEFDGFGLIGKLKGEITSKHIPTVALVPEKTPDLYQRAIEVHADDIFIQSFDIEEFFVHIKPLLRLSTMFLELENRVALAKKLGITANDEIDESNNSAYQIMLIAPHDGDRAMIEAVLNGNCKINVCDDFFVAEEELSKANYDAVICALNEENKEQAFVLSSRTRNNPRLFNLPVLFINDDNITDRLDAYRRGVTRITNRPLNKASLHAKIKMLVRRQRLRWSIRKAMDSTRAPKSTETTTHAYNQKFFEANLLHQIENAHKWHKHLTCVFFSIGNLSNIKTQFGDVAAQHLMQQIHQWISGLSRVEDCVSLYQDNEFAIALPDTPKNEAQIVMHRIAGILSYTDFALPDVFQPVSVWVECGIAQLAPNDNVKSMIQRARNPIV
ncbi:MAG: diguanylate cyclase domain-containing protein [Terasakiella sp.]|uniref:diguanylate cyclase domain-containing protein n=1 Tax=unclassified Terasakiella TaxID=2614952 RepID=UPI003B00A8A6